MKHKPKLILLISLCIISVYGFKSFKTYALSVKDQHCLVTQISSRLFDFNTFTLKVADGLDKDDFMVTNQNSGKVIYQQSQSQKGIKNDYGHCMFDLYYQGEKIYEIGHFKFNNWHTFDYTLNLQLKDGEINPHLLIYGEHASNNDIYYEKQ